MQSRQAQAGRQGKGELWSTFEEVCELLHIPPIASTNSESLLFQRMRFDTGERVYRIGQAFDTLYIVRSGFLKTVQLDELGNEQVLGFPMKGDLLGADGIHGSRCVSEAVALSDCDLILLPFTNLIALSRVHREVESFLYCMMSGELVLRQAVIGMLGALSAEARVARFLVSLAERFVRMGYSSKMFNLRMSRQEIGSYLGLTLETVSRTLSTFHELGLVTVHQRCVGIKDAGALRSLQRLSLPRPRTRQAPATAEAWPATDGDPHTPRQQARQARPAPGGRRQ